MSLSSSTASITHLGNGVTTVFAVPFRFYTNSELRVTETLLSTGFKTVLSSALYTVLGAGDDTGGTLTYLKGGNPLPVDYSIRIDRVVPLTQDLVLPREGLFSPENLEVQLDRQVMMLQDISRDLNSLEDTDTLGRLLAANNLSDLADSVTARTNLGLDKGTDISEGDWDDALKAGDYFGFNAANAPSASWWMGTVEVHTIAWVTQVISSFTTNSPTNTMTYRRQRQNFVWTAWTRVLLHAAEITSFGVSIPALTTASGSAPSYALRAWVNFNGTGTVAIRASGNVTSITDNAVGDYTVNITTALASTNYAFVGEARNTVDDWSIVPPNVVPRLSQAKTTSTLRFMVGNSASLDSSEVNIMVVL